MKIKENFLTIPDAPDYEINSQLIVRKKSNGRILKSYKRPNRNAIVVNVHDDNGKLIKRDIKTFRRQAVTAVKDKNSHLDWWVKLPSLNYLYEINPSGVLRNVKFKHKKKMFVASEYKFFIVSINGKSVRVSLNQIFCSEYCRLVMREDDTPVIKSPAEKSNLDKLVDEADACGLSYGNYKAQIAMGKTFEELKLLHDKKFY